MSQAEQQPNQNSNAKESSAPESCKGGCGFFGNPDYSGYCSVCFKQFVPAEQQEKILAKQKEKTKDEKNSESKDDSSKDSEDDKPKKPIQKKKNRCWQCKKKITLAGRFECKCGYVFCSAHRYADAHNCDFDHQAEHKKKLETMNEVIAPSKVNKI